MSLHCTTTTAYTFQITNGGKHILFCVVITILIGPALSSAWQDDATPLGPIYKRKCDINGYLTFEKEGATFYVNHSSC